MDLTKITKIIGEYDGSKKWLEADDILGGVNYCMAVSKSTDNDNIFYFPRSGLLEDIRKITKNSSQVLAILQKDLSDAEKYKTIKNSAKGLNIKSLMLPKGIADMIDISDI